MTTVVWKSQNSSVQPGRPHKIVETLGWQLRVQSHIWSPPTDIFEIDSGYVVRVEVAGMHHKDFTIQLEDNYLIISGTRHDKPERRAYYQMEKNKGTIIPKIEPRPHRYRYSPKDENIRR